ncbi:MAG: restriction endonuclease subunit S [Thermoanaerobaculales bacterium]
MEVTPGYKQTEVGVTPSEWETSRLQDIVGRNSPIAYGVLKPGDYVYNGVPLLQIRDVIHGEINVDELHRISRQLDRQYSRTRLGGGELVVSLVGTIGRVAIIPMTLAGANLHRNLARVHVSQKHDSTFVFYYLNSDVAQAAIKLTTFGSTQALLNLADLRGLMIVVPPLPEQRAIAKALCDVDALLGGLDRLIAKKRDLKQAAMQQLLTGRTRLPDSHGKWEVKRLGDISRFLAGTYLAQDDYRDGEYEIQGAGSVMGRHATANFPEPVSVIGRVGTVGRPRFMPKGCWVNSNAAAIAANAANSTPEFVHLLLLTVDWSKATSVTAQPFLVVPALIGMEFSVPPRPEQATIATVLFDMDAELSALEARRNKTRNLKQAIMQELLTGRTRLA